MSHNFAKTMSYLENIEAQLREMLKEPNEDEVVDYVLGKLRQSCANGARSSRNGPSDAGGSKDAPRSSDA